MRIVIKFKFFCICLFFVESSLFRTAPQERKYGDKTSHSSLLSRLYNSLYAAICNNNNMEISTENAQSSANVQASYNAWFQKNNNSENLKHNIKMLQFALKILVRTTEVRLWWLLHMNPTRNDLLWKRNGYREPWCEQ